MKILLTGHKGFIGKHVQSLLPDDIDLMTLTAKDFGEFDKCIYELPHHQFDLIIHLGAVSNTFDTTSRVWKMNVAATHLLLKQFCQEGNRFVFASSYSIYELTTDYAYTKLICEDLIKQHYHKNNYAILRIANVWADDEAGKENPSIIYKYRNNLLDTLYTNWHREFVHVQAVAQYIVSLVSDWQPGTFDLGTGHPIRCSELQNIFPGIEDVETKEHERESYLWTHTSRLPSRNWSPIPIHKFSKHDKEIGKNNG